MFKKLVLLLLINFTSLFALTSTLNLEDSHKHIGKSLLVYEDPSAKLSFKEISQKTLANFKPLKTDIFSTPFNTSAYWFYFELDNPQGVEIERLLVFEAPWLDYINLNIISEDSSLVSHELGNTFKYSNRSLDTNLINLRHKFKPGKSEVYIQVKTRDPFVFAISVMKENTFLLQESKNFFFLGALYGVIVALLLYNLFLFIGTKQIHYLYYVLFVFSFMASHATYNNYTFQFFFADAPLIQTWMQSNSIFLFSLGSLFFTKSFLNLKTLNPKLNTITKNFISFFIVTMILAALVGGYRYHIILVVSYAAFVGGFNLLIAFLSWRSGNQSARFFILGSISGLIGAIITSFAAMGFITFTPLTYHALDIGMMIDAILLSLALADKLRIAYQEKYQAEKASKTDVLTGLLNRRAYYEIGAKESSLYQRHKNDTTLILLDIDEFKAFNDTYGHDVGDKVLQYFAKVLQKSIREEDYAFRLGGDEFLLLLSEADEKKAEYLTSRIKQELLTNKLQLGEQRLGITVSVGIAQFQKEDSFISSVEKRADIELYKAKDLI